MEIRNLRTFLQVAERKSFTQAAHALNYTQSTVSAQIKQLENEIGAQLFERIHHKVILTEKGELLLKHAYKIINILEEINSTDTNSDDCEGIVRFAMAPSVCNFMMGKTYMTFHKMYPNIRVNILEANTEDMLDMLDRNDVDLIFTVDRHIYNKDYMIISDRPVSMHFVTGKDFDLKGKRSFSIQELSEYPFVLTEKDLSYRRLFDEKLSSLSLDVSPVVEIGNTNLLLELIELGAGISFLPDYVTKKSYEQGNIIYLDVPDFEIDIWRQLIYHKNKWVSPAMKRVVDYCAGVSDNQNW
ncbi:MAG: LysR family transcriptional regulator [Oscillospiraceae bacterium]|nr:LysR family transcriptional regulator [Oscillospiraceae bacterium]